MWGRVRLYPKFIPDAASMKLFGPGVMEATKKNQKNGSEARRRAVIMIYSKSSGS